MASFRVKLEQRKITLSPVGLEFYKSPQYFKLNKIRVTTTFVLIFQTRRVSLVSLQRQ